MQKIIFILIAMIVNYIAAGKAYCPEQLERSLSGSQGNTQVGAIVPVQKIDGFPQNGAGSSVCSFRSGILPKQE